MHDQIRRVTPLVEAGHRHDVRVSVGINQNSFAPEEYVATYSAAMHEAGAPEIMLYDGGSGMGPEAYAFMVRLVCEHAPDAVVGVHTHNMFDLAVATALESAKAGARVLEVSVNGYCSASGQADLAATTMALNALYGVKTGIDLSKLTPLARLAEKIVGYEIAWNHPVTGREVFNWGGTELVKNAIGSVVDEMVLTVVRIAYSSIMKDTMDLSSAFCDRNGRMIAQGLSLPLHLGSIPDAMQAVIGKYGNDIAPGDVVVLNDPYEAGGMHLPDIFMFVPVFVDDYLLGYAVLVGHYNDVGGRVPGSSAADSTEIYQEGLRIPVLKLYERGRANETLLELIRINVRIPDVVLGDLQAQLAACRIGERGVSELARRYGFEGLERHFEELLAYSERAARQTIRSIPDGVYRYTDFLDDDGVHPDRPVPIRVAVEVRDDEVTFDFAGSSPQVAGAINCTLSFVKSAVYFALRSVMSSDAPNNAGFFRPITVKAELGSILNPRSPGACAARGVTGFRVIDAITGALAEAVARTGARAGRGRHDQLQHLRIRRRGDVQHVPGSGDGQLGRRRPPRRARRRRQPGGEHRERAVRGRREAGAASHRALRARSRQRRRGAVARRARGDAPVSLPR